MALAIPIIPNIIERRAIFPSPYYNIKIIDIHRIMIDLDNKVLPITIMNAKNEKMKKLRDISLILSMMYINKIDKLDYISDYFKLKSENVKIFTNNAIKKYYSEIIYYQEILQNLHSFQYGWDVEQNCELTAMRLKEIQKYYSISSCQGFFTPSRLKRDNDE